MEPPRMEHKLVGGRCVVTVFGHVDEFTFVTFRQYLQDRIAEGHRHLVVNLEPAFLWSSVGLGVLVGALKRVRKIDGSLHLVLAEPRKLKIFQMTGLTKVFPIHATLDVVPALAA